MTSMASQHEDLGHDVINLKTVHHLGVFFVQSSDLHTGFVCEKHDRPKMAFNFQLTAELEQKGHAELVFLDLDSLRLKRLLRLRIQACLYLSIKEGRRCNDFCSFVSCCNS